MGLTSGDLSAADVAAVMGSNGGNNGWNGDGSFWIVILFLFALMGGYGNGGFGGNNGGGAMPWMIGNGDVQRGFDQSAVMNGISGLASTIGNGFANAEVSRCNAQANILQTLNSNQMALNQGMNSLAMSLQNCCCENRAATADLKYVVSNENNLDRYEAAQNTRDIIENCNRNNQAILDKLCQLEMDGIKQNYDNRIYTMQNTIDTLRSQINESNRLASQTAQTAQLLADNAAQTMALENYLNPTAIPAYLVQNPNCCQQWNNCGCNM